jgi:hypothetical protein
MPKPLTMNTAQCPLSFLVCPLSQGDFMETDFVLQNILKDDPIYKTVLFSQQDTN